MTMQATKWKKVIARFDPPLSQMRAAELCGYSGRTGQHWAAGDLKVPKAVEIMIRTSSSACPRCHGSRQIVAFELNIPTAHAGLGHPASGNLVC
jgi:hypothetical protein